ncbi:MAG TPA: protein kinase [Pyrinomonadaceae bacterium]|nr:protein kinase [Pyrinomonadaceae bacterium]
MKICPKCGKEYEDTTTLCPLDGAVLDKIDDRLIGQTLAGKYRIEELISQGGMGAVYRGTHVLMDKTVAIKVLHPALAADEKIVARFSREAKAASRISHPHAVNVTDFGEAENGDVFIVMEYLRGDTLKDVIRNDGPMSLPRVVEIIRQVSGALEAAHSEGVVHRDLKSDNIMLVDVGNGRDWAKVLDFGIAKIQQPAGQDPALTSPNLIIGTPQYMSPEQCSQASEIDSRSDLYSLGVILYEMLVGHVPFTGESSTAIMLKHLQEPPPPVMEERRDLPAAVGRVVARALAKRAEDRYQTAGELAEALTIAAEPEAPAVAASTTTGAGAPDRNTNRIVVPTEPNEPPRATTNSEYDEATVIRPRGDQAAGAETDEVFSQVAAPAETFNPWRVVVPAVVGLVVIFGVIYALTRSPGQPPVMNDNAMPLAVDQNGQPVEPAQPATGQAEQGITSSTPAASPTVAVDAGGAQNANQQPDAEAAPPDGNANTDRQDDAQPADEDEENPDEAQPTPTPAKENNNQGRELPAPPPTGPSKDANPDEAPPPAKSKQLPKPNLPKPKPPAETTPSASNEGLIH